MHLNHLFVFHAVAQEGNISRAAARLMVSQPAVSKQLKELERSLRMPLFDRVPRGVRFTHAGKLLSDYARKIFNLADEAERALEELRGLHRGRLSVGASTTIGVYLLPEIFVRFRQKYPGVDMHLEIGDSAAIRNSLNQGSIDIGLTEKPVEDDAFDSVVLMRDKMVAIAKPNHPLARKQSVSLAALCREPFVVRETGSESKSLIERALVERGLTIKPAMSLGSTEAIKRAVAGGVGVAIVSILSIELEVKAKKLAVIRVSNLEISRALYRVSLRGAQPSRTVTAFDELFERFISLQM
jgi:DNA-binding transcriptional LysR family regulator